MPQHDLPRWPAPEATPPASASDTRPLDTLMTRRVHEMVVWRSEFDASGVTVGVRDGTAILTGTVARSRDSREACRLAASVRGVRHVENHLQVRR